MDRRAFLLAASAIPAAALVPRAAAEALGVDVSRATNPARALAFVTADLEAHVAVVDTASGRVVSRIATLAGPRSIETVGRIAVCAHTALGRLTLIDGDARQVRRVVTVHGAPRYAAAHEHLAHVTDSARRELVTVDVLRGAVVARERVPGPARHVTITPDGESIWTALGSTAATIAVLDARRPRRPRLARTVSAPFLAHDVVAAPDGEHIWVTSGNTRSVAIFDRVHRRPLEMLAAGAPPQHIAFADGLALVTSGDDGTLRVHRLDGRLVREVEIPVGSFNVTREGRVAVAPSLTRGTIAVFRPDGRLRSVRTIARAAHDACLVPID